MNNTIKIIQVNKGDSDFSSRSEQINELIVKYRPQIIVINELNSKSTDTITRNQFENYKLETDNLDIIDQMSRTGILLHKDIHYSRRKDLETMGISSVWVQLAHPGRKPVLIQALYRQFQRLGRKGSITPASQTARWHKIINKWELASSEDKEIITLGDLNLNCLRWDLQPAEMNSYDRYKKPMIDEFKLRILDKGHKILSLEPTKINDNPEAHDSCLDLMITNRVDKIASYQAGLPSFSDHTVQMLIRQTKPLQTTQKYIRTRDFKNFDRIQYKSNIMNHPNYISTLYEGESDTITQNIQQIINDSLAIMAPVKTIQIKHKNKTRLSEEVRYKMVDRDLAYIKSKQTKKPEDIREYKNLKNQVNNQIAKEKFDKKVRSFQGEDKNLGDKWRVMKKESGQSKFTSPQMIIEGDKIITKHSQMAATLNRQYLQKVRKIFNEIESTPVNPLDHYSKVVGESKLSFTFKQVSMAQLRSTLHRMKATGSTGEDDIST